MSLLVPFSRSRCPQQILCRAALIGYLLFSMSLLHSSTGVFWDHLEIIYLHLDPISELASGGNQNETVFHPRSYGIGLGGLTLGSSHIYVYMEALTRQRVRLTEFVSLS